MCEHFISKSRRFVHVNNGSYHHRKPSSYHQVIWTGVILLEQTL